MNRLAASIAVAAAAAGVLDSGRPESAFAIQRAQHHPGPATVAVSADGRLLAFESSAPLTAADRNAYVDIYVLDRSSGSVTLESVAVDGGPANGTNGHPRLSGDGRYLVFSSTAANLVDGGSRLDIPQVFLRDRYAATTVVVSRTPAGTPGNWWSGAPDISEDGGTVVFESAATDLVATPDRNGRETDVYAHDVASRTLDRVSVDAAGAQAEAGSSYAPSVSGDGRYVAFVSSSPLVGGPRRDPRGPALRRVFVRDRKREITRLISRTPGGGDPDGPSFHPAISGDGRVVAFVSVASDLGPSDRNDRADVYLHDVQTEQTALVSRSARGGSAGGASRYPTLSSDGRFVAFVSDASDLLCARRCPPRLTDLNLVDDVYLSDTLTQRIVRVSGTRADLEPWWEVSAGPALGVTGDSIAFSSRHAIDSTDTAHDFDVFVELVPHLLDVLRMEAGARRR